jgi:hypothetical protein
VAVVAEEPPQLPGLEDRAAGAATVTVLVTAPPLSLSIGATSSAATPARAGQRAPAPWASMSRTGTTATTAHGLLATAAPKQPPASSGRPPIAASPARDAQRRPRSSSG